MASLVAERRPPPVPAPAAPKPSPVPALAPAAGGALAAQVRQLDAAAGPRVKLGLDAPPVETVALKGRGTFAPPDAVAKWLGGRRGGGAVNVAFHGLGAGPIQVFEHKGQYATPELQAIPIVHPALDPLRTVKLEPVLAIAIARSEVTGYVTIAHGGRPVPSPRSVLAGILGSAGPLSAAGLSKLEPSGKYVNALADGKLTLSTDLAVTIGGYFHGAGSFGLADDIVTFTAEAAASVGKTKLTLSAARDEKGAISGSGSGEVALEHFQGSFVVSYAGGVVAATATANYSTEKFVGSVTLIVTDAKTADSVAYSHLPPDKIAAAGIDAAGGAVGAVTPGTAMPKPGPRAIAGWGTLDAHFNDWLTGKALVIVDSKGHVTVIGEITPPAVVTFDRTKLDITKRIFKFEVRAGYGIPVVGEIFVFFSLSLDAIARVSPLTLSKIRIAGTYSTNPEIPKDFSISANLNVSALAGLQLEAAAGAGLEIMEHDLKIGAALTALAGIKAYVNAIPSIEYLETADPREGRRGDFHIHGAVEIAGQPFLQLGGKLFVAIETPWWSPLSDRTWEWPLGTLEYPLPGEFGLGADIDYVLGAANPPAISFKSVDFNAERFAGDLMDDKVPTGHPADQEKAGAWTEKVPAKPPPPPPPPATPKLKSSQGKPPAKNNSAVKQDGMAQQAGAKAIDALRKRADATPMPAAELVAQLEAIRTRCGLTDLHSKPGTGILEVTAGRGKLKLPKPIRIKVSPSPVKLPPDHARAPKAASGPKPGQTAAREEPFSVEGPSGIQQHHVIARPAADGRAQIFVASDETPLSQVIAHYGPLVNRLPQSGAAPPSPRPRGWRENDQPRMQAEASITRLRRVPDRPAGVSDAFVPGMKDDLARLLHMFAVYDRPPQARLATGSQAGQQMWARLVLRPDTKAPGAQAGVLPGTRSSLAGRYAQMLPDPNLVETVPTSRGSVYSDVPNEVVARTWASGGTRREATNTSHTENQFERWLSAQGAVFLGRISSIELRSNLSPCSACTDVLTGMLRQVRSAQAQGAPRVLAAFFWEEPYEAPRDNPSSIQSTSAHHIAALRSAGWLLYGPMPK